MMSQLAATALLTTYATVVCAAGITYLLSDGLVTRTWQATLLLIAAAPALTATILASPHAVFPTRWLIKIRAAKSYDHCYALFARLAAIYSWSPLYRLITNVVLVPVVIRLAPYTIDPSQALRLSTAVDLDEMISFMPAWQRQVGTAIGLGLSTLFVNLLCWFWQRQEARWHQEDLEQVIRAEQRRREKSAPPPSYGRALHSPPLYTVLEVEEPIIGLKIES